MAMTHGDRLRAAARAHRTRTDRWTKERTNEPTNERTYVPTNGRTDAAPRCTALRCDGREERDDDDDERARGMEELAGETVAARCAPRRAEPSRSRAAERTARLRAKRSGHLDAHALALAAHSCSGRVRGSVASHRALSFSWWLQASQRERERDRKSMQTERRGGRCVAKEGVSESRKSGRVSLTRYQEGFYWLLPRPMSRERPSSRSRARPETRDDLEWSTDGRTDTAGLGGRSLGDLGHGGGLWRTMAFFRSRKSASRASIRTIVQWAG